jgi:ribosomal protein S12 methylthiotransferase accessory factor
MARPVAPKAFRHGAHRMSDPGESFARLRHLAPAMGITRIADVTGLDRVGVPVVMVHRPNGRSIAVLQGKGATLAAARMSGFMEAAETYHAETIEAPLRHASHDALSREAAVACDGLPRGCNSRFRPDLPLRWIEGVDLIGGGPVWVPYELVHTDYRVPAPADGGCFSTCSTGLAGGSHKIEAIAHGLCEVIERDAVTLWLLRSDADQRMSRIDPASVDDPLCRSVLDRIAAAGLVAQVWDVTSDLGVAAFLCRLHDPEAQAGAIPEGAGCHLAREVALLRALTEAMQSRLTVIAGVRDDLFWPLYETAPPPLPGLEAGDGPGKPFRSVPTGACEDLQDDVDVLLRRLEGIGLHSAIVVDLTKPAIGIPIVRVLVPGLEDGWHQPDYEPGPRALAAFAWQP